jgi:NDP-sugar pyrophosphorylase family protein
VSLATHHLSDPIVEHFKDGSEFGVNLNYIHESEPRGTAGALSRLPASSEPFLVMNGDILTSVDVRAMLNFHRDQMADLSVGVRQYDIEVPFGVVETHGVNVTGIMEKPVLRHFINAGIYLVNPPVCHLVPQDRRFDMTDLIAAVLESGGNVVCFPIREYWLDIGQIEQYQRAKVDVSEGVV